MGFHVVDEYPQDAAAGCDYISRAPRGELTERDEQGEPFQRPEKVVVTDVFNDWEGRVCIGERTARQLAHEFGMVDGWRFRLLVDQCQTLADERDLLSRELADSRQQVENLLEMQNDPPPTLFIAIDGSRHASAGAAEDASRRLVGSPAKALEGAVDPAVEPIAEIHASGVEAATKRKAAKK